LISKEIDGGKSVGVLRWNMAGKKQTEHLVLGLLIFCMVFSAFLGIQYRNGQEKVETREDPLVFLGNESLAPILYREGGVPKGVVADIVKELSRKMGMPIQVELMNWEDAQKAFLSGYGDALLQMNYTEEREKLYGFSSPLLESEFALFVRYGDRRIRGMEDLQGKTVAVESMGYSASLLSEVEGVHIITMQDMASGFQSLEKGNLDAIIMDRWIGAYQLARSRAGGISILRDAVQVENSHIAVRKENSRLLQEVNNALKAMEQDGSMEKILYSWQGEKVVYVTEDHYLNLLLVGMVLVMLILLIGTVFNVNRFRTLSIQLRADVESRTRDLEEAKKKLEEANEELLMQSLLDPLTGIPNRRYFDDVFQRILEESQEEKRPVSLFILDIDNFKNFNDTYGHLAGDRCLKKTAEELYWFEEEKRGFAARYGGEEFVLLLEADQEEAANWEIYCEERSLRWRWILERNPFPLQ